MIKKTELVLLPQEAADQEKRKTIAAATLGVPAERITFITILKRSIDARSKQPKIRFAVEVFIDEQPPLKKDPSGRYNFNRDVSKSKPVLIAGFGPAGMFAALRLIELG